MQQKTTQENRVVVLMNRDSYLFFLNIICFKIDNFMFTFMKQQLTGSVHTPITHGVIGWVGWKNVAIYAIGILINLNSVTPVVLF